MHKDKETVASKQWRYNRIELQNSKRLDYKARKAAEVMRRKPYAGNEPVNKEEPEDHDYDW